MLWLERATQRQSPTHLRALPRESKAQQNFGAGKHRLQLCHVSARRQIERIEEGSEQWLASDLGPDWRRNPDAEAMLAALEHVLPACLPGPKGFAAEDIDASRNRRCRAYSSSSV